MSGLNPIPPTAATPPDVWTATADSSDFIELRRRLRGFVLPVTAAFLLWYALYVVLATYAPTWLAHRVDGTITVGLLLGVAQILSTFAVTALYLRFASTRLDPLAARVRTQVEDLKARHLAEPGADADSTHDVELERADVGSGEAR